MNMENTRWVRSARTTTAHRTDNLTVTLNATSWVAVTEGKTVALPVLPLGTFIEKAIEAADEAYPPAPWSIVEGVWRAGAWCVRPDASGWLVEREIGGVPERASRQTFPSADRARRWAELRFDRTEVGLRGPKPRAGSKSGAKLPDVRVTEAERHLADSVLESLDMSYAVFVRAALEWAKNHIVDDTTWCVTREEEPKFVRRT
jgi:hypothetical protein